VFHGVFQGVGHGLMFCPAVTMTAVYFEESRMKITAMSLAVCGGATGGILFPIIARYTIDSLGISWTLWIMCGVVLVTSILIQVFAQPKPLSSRDAETEGPLRNGRLVEWSAF
jgi:MFS family permease